VQPYPPIMKFLLLFGLDFSDEGLAATARQFSDVIWLNDPITREILKSLKSLNLAIRLHMYRNLFGTLAEDKYGLQEGAALAGDLPREYFLYKKRTDNGALERVTFNDYPYFAMNPANTDWQKVWIDKAIKDLDGTEWNSVFIDDVLVRFAEHGLQNQGQLYQAELYDSEGNVVITNDEDLRRAVLGFLANIRARFDAYNREHPDAPKEVLANVSGSYYTPGLLADILQYVDGVSEEGFVLGWGWDNETTNVAQAQLEAARDARKDGKRMFLISYIDPSWTPAEQQAYERRALSAYLLIAGTKSKTDDPKQSLITWILRPPYADRPFYRTQWEVALGNAQGDAVVTPKQGAQNGGATWVRHFEGGVVFGNTTDQTQTIEVQRNGRTVRIDVGPKDATYVLDPAGRAGSTTIEPLVLTSIILTAIALMITGLLAAGLLPSMEALIRHSGVVQLGLWPDLVTYVLTSIAGVILSAVYGEGGPVNRPNVKLTKEDAPRLAELVEAELGRTKPGLLNKLRSHLRGIMAEPNNVRAVLNRINKQFRKKDELNAADMQAVEAAAKVAVSTVTTEKAAIKAAEAPTPTRSESSRREALERRLWQIIGRARSQSFSTASASYRPVKLPGVTLHIIEGEHNSLDFVDEFEAQILPLIQDKPEEWLFLVEMPTEEEQQVSLQLNNATGMTGETGLGQKVGELLNIAVVNPTFGIFNRQVIEAALREGLSRSELFQGWAIEGIDMKVRHTGRMPDESDIRYYAKMFGGRWGVDPSELAEAQRQAIALERRDSAAATALHSRVQQTLTRLANKMSRELLTKALNGQVGKRQILVMGGSLHTKEIEQVIRAHPISQASSSIGNPGLAFVELLAAMGAIAGIAGFGLAIGLIATSHLVAGLSVLGVMLGIGLTVALIRRATRRTLSEPMPQTPERDVFIVRRIERLISKIHFELVDWMQTAQQARIYRRSALADATEIDLMLRGPAGEETLRFTFEEFEETPNPWDTRLAQAFARLGITSSRADSWQLSMDTIGSPHATTEGSTLRIAADIRPLAPGRGRRGLSRGSTLTKVGMALGAIGGVLVVGVTIAGLLAWGAPAWAAIGGPLVLAAAGGFAAWRLLGRMQRLSQRQSPQSPRSEGPIGAREIEDAITQLLQEPDHRPQPVAQSPLSASKLSATKMMTAREAADLLMIGAESQAVPMIVAWVFDVAQGQDLPARLQAIHTRLAALMDALPWGRAPMTLEQLRALRELHDALERFADSSDSGLWPPPSLTNAEYEYVKENIDRALRPLGMHMEVLDDLLEPDSFEVFFNKSDEVLAKARARLLDEENGPAQALEVLEVGFISLALMLDDGRQHLEHPSAPPEQRRILAEVLTRVQLELDAIQAKIQAYRNDPDAIQQDVLAAKQDATASQDRAKAVLEALKAFFAGRGGVITIDPRKQSIMRHELERGAALMISLLDTPSERRADGTVPRRLSIAVSFPSEWQPVVSDLSWPRFKVMVRAGGVSRLVYVQPQATEFGVKGVVRGVDPGTYEISLVNEQEVNRLLGGEVGSAPLDLHLALGAIGGVVAVGVAIAGLLAAGVVPLLAVGGPLALVAVGGLTLTTIRFWPDLRRIRRIQLPFEWVPVPALRTAAGPVVGLPNGVWRPRPWIIFAERTAGGGLADRSANVKLMPATASVLQEQIKGLLRDIKASIVWKDYAYALAGYERQGIDRIAANAEDPRATLAQWLRERVGDPALAQAAARKLIDSLGADKIGVSLSREERRQLRAQERQRLEEAVAAPAGSQEVSGITPPRFTLDALLGGTALLERLRQENRGQPLPAIELRGSREAVKEAFLRQIQRQAERGLVCLSVEYPISPTRTRHLVLIGTAQSLHDQWLHKKFDRLLDGEFALNQSIFGLSLVEDQAQRHLHLHKVWLGTGSFGAKWRGRGFMSEPLARIRAMVRQQFPGGTVSAVAVHGATAKFMEAFEGVHIADGHELVRVATYEPLFPANFNQVLLGRIQTGEPAGPDQLPAYTGSGDTVVHVALARAERGMTGSFASPMSVFLGELLDSLQTANRAWDQAADDAARDEAIHTLMTQVESLLTRWKIPLPSLPVDLRAADLPAAIRQTQALLDRSAVLEVEKALDDRTDPFQLPESERRRLKALLAGNVENVGSVLAEMNATDSAPKILLVDGQVYVPSGLFGEEVRMFQSYNVEFRPDAPDQPIRRLLRVYKRPVSREDVELYAWAVGQLGREGVPVPPMRAVMAEVPMKDGTHQQAVVLTERIDGVPVDRAGADPALDRRVRQRLEQIQTITHEWVGAGLADVGDNPANFSGDSAYGNFIVRPKLDRQGQRIGDELIVVDPIRLEEIEAHRDALQAARQRLESAQESGGPQSALQGQPLGERGAFGMPLLGTLGAIGGVLVVGVAIAGLLAWGAPAWAAIGGPLAIVGVLIASAVAYRGQSGRLQSAAPPSAQMAQELRWPEDVNPTEGMETEKIGVARDNGLGVPRDGAFKHGVVADVAAGRHGVTRLNDEGGLADDRQQSAAFLRVQGALPLGTIQDTGQLVDEKPGDHQMEPVSEQGVEDGTRAATAQQRAEEHVSVDYRDAHRTPDERARSRVRRRGVTVGSSGVARRFDPAAGEIARPSPAVSSGGPAESSRRAATDRVIVPPVSSTTQGPVSASHPSSAQQPTAAHGTRQATRRGALASAHVGSVVSPLSAALGAIGGVVALSVLGAAIFAATANLAWAIGVPLAIVAAGVAAIVAFRAWNRARGQTPSTAPKDEEISRREAIRVLAGGVTGLMLPQEPAKLGARPTAQRAAERPTEQSVEQLVVRRLQQLYGPSRNASNAAVRQAITNPAFWTAIRRLSPEQATQARDLAEAQLAQLAQHLRDYAQLSINDVPAPALVMFLAQRINTAWATEQMRTAPTQEQITLFVEHVLRGAINEQVQWAGLVAGLRAQDPSASITIAPVTRAVYDQAVALLPEPLRAHATQFVELLFQITDPAKRQATLLGDTVSFFDSALQNLDEALLNYGHSANGLIAARAQDVRVLIPDLYRPATGRAARVYALTGKDGRRVEVRAAPVAPIVERADSAATLAWTKSFWVGPLMTSQTIIWKEAMLVRRAMLIARIKVMARELVPGVLAQAGFRVHDPIVKDIIDEAFGALTPEQIAEAYRTAVMQHELLHAWANAQSLTNRLPRRPPERGQDRFGLTPEERAKVDAAQGFEPYVAGEMAAYLGQMIVAQHPQWWILHQVTALKPARAEDPEALAADWLLKAIAAELAPSLGLDAKAHPSQLSMDEGVTLLKAIREQGITTAKVQETATRLFESFFDTPFEGMQRLAWLGDPLAPSTAGAIQRLAVRFAIDRAGLVGADGATHAGSYDVAYLACLPDFVVMAAADELELMHMVATAAQIDDRPSAFRYPRGEGVGVELPARGTPLEIGKGRIVREGTKIAILSFGTRLAECLVAAEDLAAKGLSATVADARFAKPLDTDLIRRLAREHEVLITVEEGAVGGFASHVLQYLATSGLLDQGLKVRPLVLPDRFIDQASPARQYEQAGLDAPHIVAAALAALGRQAERARG